MSVDPLPNMDWHWRFPEHLPTSCQPKMAMKGVMSEQTFKRYWRYVAIPGYLGGSAEEEE
jgi:hypothetical protein